MCTSLQEAVRVVPHQPGSKARLRAVTMAVLSFYGHSYDRSEGETTGRCTTHC